MITYVYTALDAKSGKKIRAEVEADNEQAAARLLTDRGLAPLEIKVKPQRGSVLSFLGRVRTKQKVIFSRQLATFANAGLPLVQSLRSLSGQTKNKKFKEAIDKIVNDVEGGSSLSDAMARHPDVFDSVYVNMVAAGETSGTLDLALQRLADQQEKDAEVMSKVRGAMVYPLIILLAIMGLVIFMMTTVLPQVQVLYNQIPGAQLPFITSLLLFIGQAIVSFWWLFILLLGVAVFIFLHWRRTNSGRQVLDRLKMRLWPIGRLFMKVYMARFTRVSSTLVGSGMPLLKMLNTAGDAIGNVHIAESLKKAAEQVKGGKSLSESLAGDPNFLDLVPQMIQTGEQSGALEGMLDKVATYYEKEVDNEIKTVSTIIEPVLMITVGIIALIVVAAVLLPIYSLVGKTPIR